MIGGIAILLGSVVIALWSPMFALIVSAFFAGLSLGCYPGTRPSRTDDWKGPLAIAIVLVAVALLRAYRVV